MQRLLVTIALCVALATAVWFGMFGEEKRKPFTVGVLLYTDNNIPTLQGFKDAMKDFGHVEGETINYIFDRPVSSKNMLAPYMEKLLQAKPDIIFASPTPAALTAKRLTAGTDIPVIFAPVNDPVSSGIVNNPTRPEGNITGVRLSPSDGRRLMSLAEIVPDIKRVFVPHSARDISSSASIAMLDEAAPKLGITLVKKVFTKNTNIITDVEYVPTDIDAIFLPREGLVMSRIKQFVELSNQRNLPLSTPRYNQVEQGALTGYGFMGYELGVQAARMAHTILAGTPVAQVPVETSQDYLFINLKTAKQIGVTIDDALIRRAHKIIR